MYKLIALDLDGTLTNDQKEITDETRDLLIELEKKGVHVVLASGRPTPGIDKEATTLQFKNYGGYLLSYNGARVLDYRTGKVIYDQTVSSDMAHELYNRAKRFGLSCMSYDDTHILTEDIGDHWVQIESFTTKMPIKHVLDFKDSIQTPVNKILITGEPSYVQTILDDFKAPYENQLSIYRSNPYFIECMASGIDKAASLARLCDYLGVSQEETIAFGDGYNDLSLIEWCHTGVAMENAVDEVKQRADVITKSNNDNGVYVYLKQLIEENKF